MRKPIITLMFFMSLLAGCSHTPSVEKTVAPLTYKIDLQQGNVVSQEMVAKLHQGMTPPQVRYVMGSPLVIDPFHPDRWDYVYLYEKGHKVTERHRLTVIFVDGKLARLEGDVNLQDTLSAPEKTSDTPAATTAPIAAPAAAPASAPVPPPSAQTTDAAKSGAAPLVTAPAQPVAAQPGTAPSNDTAQPNATTSPAAMPVAGSTNTNQPAAAEADTTKSSADQNQKQRGFFGRMLDKIGL